MTDQSQIIKQQRKLLSEASARATALSKQKEQSQKELRSRKRTLQRFAQQRAEQQKKEKLGRTQEREVAVAGASFETEVAQKSPEHGKPQYVEKAYSQAKEKVSSKISILNQKIASLKQRIQNKQDRWDKKSSKSRHREGAKESYKDDIDDYEDDISEVEAERSVYSKALKDSKVNLIKGSFSGNIKNLADYQRDKKESHNEYLERRREWKAKQRELEKLQQPLKETITTKMIGPEKVGDFSSQVLLKQAPGTYDPSTGSYIPLEGSGQGPMTMAQEYVPKGTKIIGPPVPSIQDIFKPTYSMPKELKKAFDKGVAQQEVKLNIQKVQVQSYKDMGFSARQSQTLADKGWQQKVSFTPEGARQIILASKELPITERSGVWVEEKIKKGVKKIKEVVPKVMGSMIGSTEFISEQEYKPLIFGVGIPGTDIGFGKRIDTGITEGEKAALIESTLSKFEEEVIGPGWSGIYGETISKLPSEWQPSKVISGKEAEYKKLIEDIQSEKLKPKDVDFTEFVIPYAPEEIGAGVKTAFKFGTYALPYLGSARLVSGVAEGAEEFKHPEKIADKRFEETWIDYNQKVKEAKSNLAEGYELTDIKTKEELKEDIYPKIIEDVKKGGLTESIVSASFLAGYGIIKVGSKVFKSTVPKSKYLGMTETEYAKVLKEAEKEVSKLGKQDIAWIGKVEKDAGTGKVFIRGEQKFGGFKRDIKVYGELKKTESGRVFIPKGKGEVGGKGELFFGKKKTPYQYLEAQKFEVGSDALSIRGKKFLEYPKLVEEIPSKIKLLRESSLIQKGMKEEFKIVEESIKGTEGIKVFPEELAEAQTYKVLGKTTTIPKAGSFALYKIKPKYIKPSERVVSKIEKAVEKQMKEHIYFGGDVLKKVEGEAAIQIKPNLFLVSGRKEAGLLVVKEVKKAGEELGVTFVKGEKTPFSKTFQELEQLKQVPTLIRTPKIPKPRLTKLAPKEVVTKIGEEVYFPKMVGGTGEVVSKYAGRGIYERTKGDSIFKQRIDREAGNLITQKKSLILSSGITQTPLKVLEKDEVSVEKEKEKSILLTTERLKIDQVAIPIQKSLQKTTQETDVGFKSVSFKPAVSEIKIEVFPKLKIIPKIKPSYEHRLTIQMKKPVPKQGYVYEYRVRGKWQRAKTPFAYATKVGAEVAAQERVLKGATASYKIVKAKKGKRVVRTRKKLSPYRDVLFRKGKEAGVMVQKKLLRILSEGEKREISYAGALARMKTTKPVFKMTKKLGFKRKTILGQTKSKTKQKKTKRKIKKK